MKITFPILILCFVFLGFSSYSHATTKLIPGTEIPEVKTCEGSGTAYIYSNYVVYTEPSGDFDGVNINIYAPGSADPCKLDPKTAHYSVGVGEFGGINKFAGLYGNLAFIDQWTGRDFKRLLALNIENKSLVFLDTYAEAEIDNGVLKYLRTLKAKRKSVRDKIPCPDADTWKEQGKQVLYVEQMSAGLETMKKISTNEFSCMPSDPIATTKPKSYGH